jgi:hypothetical protein
VLDLNLPDGQTRSSMSRRANKKTVVVLETGGLVVAGSARCLVRRAGVVSGHGGRRVRRMRVLTGEVNCRGHSARQSSPASLAQHSAGAGGRSCARSRLHPDGNYDIEGVAVGGYKRFDATVAPPVSFGHGLF